MKLFGNLFKERQRESLDHPDLDHFHKIFSSEAHRRMIMHQLRQQQLQRQRDMMALEQARKKRDEEIFDVGQLKRDVQAADRRFLKKQREIMQNPHPIIQRDYYEVEVGDEAIESPEEHISPEDCEHIEI